MLLIKSEAPAKFENKIGLYVYIYIDIYIYLKYKKADLDFAAKPLVEQEEPLWWHIFDEYPS